MKKLTKKQKTEYNALTDKERKIYDSVIQNFSETSHESALGVAWQGGVNWQFICK